MITVITVITVIIALNSTLFGCWHRTELQPPWNSAIRGSPTAVDRRDSRNSNRLGLPTPPTTPHTMPTKEQWAEGKLLAAAAKGDAEDRRIAMRVKILRGNKSRVNLEKGRLAKSMELVSGRLTELTTIETTIEAQGTGMPVFTDDRYIPWLEDVKRVKSVGTREEQMNDAETFARKILDDVKINRVKTSLDVENAEHAALVKRDMEFGRQLTSAATEEAELLQILMVRTEQRLSTGHALASIADRTVTQKRRRERSPSPVGSPRASRCAERTGEYQRRKIKRSETEFELIHERLDTLVEAAKEDGVLDQDEKMDILQECMQVGMKLKDMYAHLNSRHQITREMWREGVCNSPRSVELVGEEQVCIRCNRPATDRDNCGFCFYDYNCAQGKAWKACRLHNLKKGAMMPCSMVRGLSGA